jgi:hypothetical protein
MTKQPRWITNATHIGLGAVLLIIIANYFNRPSGPVAQVSGVVQASGFVPADGPPGKIFAVRLPNGATIQAGANTSIVAKPGDVVRMNVYRRALSGAESYGVIGVEPKS